MRKMDATSGARGVLQKLESAEFEQENSLAQNEVIIFGDNKHDESSFFNDGLIDMLENNEPSPKSALIEHKASEDSEPPEEFETDIPGSGENSPLHDEQTPTMSPERKKPVKPKRRISASKGSRPGSERAMRNQKAGSNILKDLVQRQMEAAGAKHERLPTETDRIEMKKEKAPSSLSGGQTRLSARFADNGAMSSRTKENLMVTKAGRANLMDSEIFHTMMRGQHIKTEEQAPIEVLEMEDCRESPSKKPTSLLALHLNIKEAEEPVFSKSRPTGAAFEPRPATKRYIPATLSGVMQTISQQETLNRNLINEKLNPESRTRRIEQTNEVGSKIKPVRIEDVKKFQSPQLPSRELLEEMGSEHHLQHHPNTTPQITQGGKKQVRQKEDSQPKKPHSNFNNSKDAGGRRAGSLNVAKDEQQPFRKEYKLQTLDTFLKSKNATAK